MDKIFFDTNIYNHLDKKQMKKLKQLISNRAIEIFSTPQILGELAASFESDIKRVKKLVKIYGKIISYKIIKPPPELIRAEVNYCLNDGDKDSIYLDLERKNKFQKYISNFKKGIVDEDTKKFVENTKKAKKENKEFCKESKKELDYLWDDEKIAEFPNFDCFYNRATETGSIRKDIEEGLKRMLHPEQSNLISKAAKVIEKRLNELPHFEVAVKINAVLSYRYHLKKEDAKWGDIEDSLNLIAIPTCDTYVSDDEGAREIAKLLFPKKNVLSLREFFSKSKNMDIGRGLVARVEGILKKLSGIA